MKNKSFLLDRDGVIMIDKKHIVKKSDIFFFPGVCEALIYLKKKKFKIILITNQSVIGRGLITEKNFQLLSQEINTKLSIHSKVKLIDKVYFCPHHPKKGLNNFKKNCDCRKPKNGLIEKAILENKLDRKKTIMVGDKISDYFAAKKSKINFYYKNNYNFFGQIKKIMQNEKIK